MRGTRATAAALALASIVVLSGGAIGNTFAERLEQRVNDIACEQHGGRFDLTREC